MTMVETDPRYRAPLTGSLGTAPISGNEPPEQYVLRTRFVDRMGNRWAECDGAAPAEVGQAFWLGVMHGTIVETFLSGEEGILWWTITFEAIEPGHPH